MIPKYVYQYTSIKSVMKMLQNQTIRFSRLDQLNDPIEGIQEIGLKELDKTIFISSWTCETNESLPMWKMYTDLQGVRIKFPIDLFEKNSSIKMRKHFGNWHIENELINPVIVNSSEFYKDSQRNDQSLIREYLTISKIFGPTQISYLNRSEYKNQRAVEESTIDEVPGNIFNPFLTGLTKVSDWAYENEYRYWFHLPEGYCFGGEMGVLENFSGLTDETYVDIPFSQEILPEIELVLAPCCTDKDNDELLQVFNELKLNKKSIMKSQIEIRNR